MPHLKNHYENLKVDRHAPLAVIRAAYKALCQLEHPDRNPSPDAEHRMALINASYAVLSNPTRRAEHDKWIAEHEKHAAPPPAFTSHTHHQPQPETETPPAKLTAADYGDLLLELMYKHPLPSFLFFLLAIAVVSVLILSLSEKTPIDNIVTIPTITRAAPQETHAGVASAAQTRHTPPAPQKKPAVSAINARPATAPNGSPWPMTSGPISGYPVRAEDGLSTITIDNISSSDPLYLKLVQMPNERVVRQIFVAENSLYTIPNIEAGQYVIRYKKLGSPATYETENLLLQQSEDGYTTKFSKLTVELKTPPLQ